MYPDADKVTLVEDNLAAHKLSALYEIVRTPKHRSWLNSAELELSTDVTQQIKNTSSSLLAWTFSDKSPDLKKYLYKPTCL